MIRRSTLLVLASVLCASCSFEPDLSRYPACGERGACPEGMACWAEGQRCLPRCGEQPVESCEAALLLTGGAPESAIEQVPYQHLFVAEGGVPPYAFSIASGELPPGLSLEGDTLTGSPEVAGTWSFELKVQDSATPASEDIQHVSLTVEQLLRIASPVTLADGEGGADYQEQLQATGGTGGYSWSLVEGSALPPGLQLSENGTISGRPETVCGSGCGSFEVRVVDAGPSKQIQTRMFEIRIPASAVELHIRTRALADGRTGSAYTQVLRSGGGVLGSHQWALTSGSLPPGVQLQGNVLTGTPTTAGVYESTLKVTDSSLGSASRSFAITIF